MVSTGLVFCEVSGGNCEQDEKGKGERKGKFKSRGSKSAARVE